MKKGNEQDNSNHTIDNLCKRDKNKVIELLKQLNELRKRCAFLESNIESQVLENQRVEGRNEMIAKQIEATEMKFSEASDLAADTPSKLEGLTLNIQATETESSNLRMKIEDSEKEIKILQDELTILKDKYGHIYLDASVSCVAKCHNMCLNTEDLQNYENKELQIPEKEKEMEFLYDDSNSHIPDVHSAYYDQPDDEISNLIVLLNNIEK
ncbi:tropomyosin [Tritrichomonas foetus]|uniref:Tropomyosin n=1 Tax=Tritrichomonas foetus TaxID=1144522 RepID=A0A1J4K3V2_9EUKA|nr:tropomyosin [Tritrichomonas foetus]|eukprot:OHT05867.1 tropomyosin [Tritrichomonas foetus]